MKELLLMYNRLDLLGGSQTFLGILTTIVVLFIIADKSNLIHFILTEVKDKIENQIISLKINTRIDSVINSHSYKLLRYFLDKKNEGDELKAKGANLLAKITSKRANLQISYISVEGNDHKILDSIKNSKIPLLAPLYTFIFCITIFIYDELLRSAASSYVNDMIISSLSIFILISYLYWIVMWFFFIRNNDFKKINKTQKRSQSKRLIKFYWLRFNNWSRKRYCLSGQNPVIWLFLIRACICIILLTILLTINAYWYHINNYIILLISIVIPIMLIGLIRGYSFNNKKEQFSYVYTCGHYIAIIIMSILLSACIFCITNITNSTSSFLIPYTSYQWLKISIFVFILLNGIFLPFIIPYHCYNSYYNFSKKQVDDSERDAQELVKELQNELDNFCDQIPQL